MNILEVLGAREMLRLLMIEITDVLYQKIRNNRCLNRVNDGRRTTSLH
jgi:hypothetical protein